MYIRVNNNKKRYTSQKDKSESAKQLTKKYIFMTCVGDGIHNNTRNSKKYVQTVGKIQTIRKGQSVQLKQSQNISAFKVNQHHKNVHSSIEYCLQNQEQTKCNSELLSKPETPIDKLSSFVDILQLKKMPFLHNINQLAPKRMRIDARKIGKIVDHKIGLLQ